MPTADGGFYIAWKDGAESARVQRLDRAGRELWPHNGVAIGQDRFLADFTIDAAGNAVLGVLCACGSGSAALIKVAPDGSYPWGVEGIVVPGSNTAAYVLLAAPTTDGGIVGLWDEGSGFRLQKLDAKGAAQWGPGIPIVQAPLFRGKQPALVPADQGSVIAAWVAEDYPNALSSGLAQKFAADGTLLWGTGEPVVLSAGFPNVMELVLSSDGAGGAIAGWADGDVGSGTPLKIKVQHLDSAGAPRFAAGGLAVIGTAHQRYPQSPAIAHDRASGDIHVLWADRVNNPYAVYAQRIDADGNRGFGEAGKLLQAIAENAFAGNLIVLPAPGGMLAAWMAYDLVPQGHPGMRIQVVRLDAGGEHVFPDDRIEIKAGPTQIRGVTASLSTAGYAAFVWGDGIAAPGGMADDILAQNIHFDGSVGNPDDPTDPTDPTDPIYADGFEGVPEAG